MKIGGTRIDSPRFLGVVLPAMTTSTRKWLAVGSVLVASAVVLPSVLAASAGPPAGLGAAAGLYWNVDALVANKFGGARVCVQHDTVLVRKRQSAYCAEEYVRLFPRARRSAFRLVVRRRNPVAGVNVVPIRFYRSSGPYVSCGGGAWLALTNGRAQLWPVACVKP